MSPGCLRIRSWYAYACISGGKAVPGRAVGQSIVKAGSSHIRIAILEKEEIANGRA
jgi:hypothetical protein